MMLNNFGADRRPNGRQVSRYMLSFHSIANRWRSEGCTGIRRKALLIYLTLYNYYLPPANTVAVRISPLLH